MSTPKFSNGMYGLYGKYIPLFIELHIWIWKIRIGFEFSEARTDTPYLDRWILYLGPINLRLHKFYRGDDDRAPHNHPWWFITFPLTDYYEKVPNLTWPRQMSTRLVQRFRFHFRGISFKHIVMGRSMDRTDNRPFYTLVIAGNKSQDWGFWPYEVERDDRVFVYYRKWKQYIEENHL